MTDIETLCEVASTLLQCKSRMKRKRAITLLREAAIRGNEWAQYSLGYEYESGELLRRNVKEARKWYGLASAMGCSSAQVNLGRLLANARGASESDFRAAIVLYRKAAVKGNRNACYNLGFAYENGKGVRKSLACSFKWYLRAAQQGDIDAQCHIGYCYFVGEGVKRSARMAVEWYRKAAKAAYGPACYNLGLCYKDGDGVRRSKVLATKWLRRAISVGHAEAREVLRRLDD